jgi:hypothetical protein
MFTVGAQFAHMGYTPDCGHLHTNGTERGRRSMKVA